MRKSVLTAAALGLVFAAAPAIANDDKNTMTVSTKGIDLGTPEGQAMLERRVDKAARQICQLDGSATGTRLVRRGARDCYNKARASAKQQMVAAIAKKKRGG